ncbi:protein of unknown function [Pararobbsia alpina]
MWSPSCGREDSSAASLSACVSGRVVSVTGAVGVWGVGIAGLLNGFSARRRSIKHSR